MAETVHTNLVIRDELSSAAFIERLNINALGLTEATRGGFRIVPRKMEGYYDKVKFLDRLTGGSSRRDLTSTSSVSDTNLTADEHIGVKRFRKFGPYASTLGALTTANMTTDEISLAIGVMFADEVIKDYVSAGVIALEADIDSGAAIFLDYSGTGDIAHAALIQALALVGDKANRIICWFGHSKPFFDLMEASLTVSSGNVGPATIFEATVGTVNRPWVSVDDTNFGNNATPDKYTTFGLQEGAVTITESEERFLVADVQTGNEQIFVRYQGEYAYNVGIKGSSWDTSGGGNNPTDASLGTGGNWDVVVADVKDRAGVAIFTT